MHAPAIGRAAPMEQVRPLDRVGDVVALRIAQRVKVGACLDVESTVGISEALELDIELLSEDAACAFAADDVRTGDFFLAAIFAFDRSDAAIGILAEAYEGGVEAELDQLMRLGHGERFLDDLDSLALQNEGEFGIVLQDGMIEFGDQLVIGPVPIMNQRRNDPAGSDALIEAEPVEHFERDRMVGASPRNLVEEVVLTELLDKMDADPRL